MNKVFATILSFVFVIGLGTANAATTQINFQETINRVDANNFYIGDVLFTNWDIDNDWGTPGNLVLQATSFGDAVSTITFANPVNIADMWLSWIGSQVTTDTGDSYYSPVINGLISTKPAFLAAIDLTGVTVLTFSLIEQIDFYGEKMNPRVIVDNITFSSTPIPGAALLLGSGLIGLVGLRRKFSN